MARTDEQREKLALMRSRLRDAISALSDSRSQSLDDQKFVAGNSDNNWQWPSDVISTRAAMDGQSARPTLTINKLPQHVRRVTNAQRQNRPAGKIIPVDDMADPEIADLFEGMVRHIESISDADIVYDTACDNQVQMGEGYWRIVTEYEDPLAFEQDIRLKRVRNSFSVYMDPSIQDPCGMDAEWCIITEDLTHEEYSRQYPKAQRISALRDAGIGDSDIQKWVTERNIRIAEYFYVVYQVFTLNLYRDGSVAESGTPRDKALFDMLGSPIKSRPSSHRRVKWCKTNGYETLEEQDWLGQWIPVIRVVGNEFEVDGKLFVSGIIRNAKDAQRMYNYWASQEAEMLALAPKAPFIGYAGQFKGYERFWRQANIKNFPYLEVNPEATDGNGQVLPLPQRSSPPEAQLGLIQAKMGAAEDIKSTTGQYDASLGMVSNERSGKAINARKEESDTGTYHYVDNLAKAVRFSTRQLIDLIPKIYDTFRIARIVGLDNDTKSVKIDPEQQSPVRRVVNEDGLVLEKIYNPGIGKYDVVVTTGPSHLTRRQEAMESMGQIIQAAPQLWEVCGDLFVKNMDWPGAQEIAKRIQKMIDPKLLEDNGDESPALQAARMQIEGMAQEMEQMHKMLQQVSQSFEARELQIKEFEARVRAFDAETKRLSATIDRLTPDQVQDMVAGTIDAMRVAGDL